jgi:hypothetical protein
MENTILYLKFGAHAYIYILQHIYICRFYNLVVAHGSCECMDIVLLGYERFVYSRGVQMGNICIVLTKNTKPWVLCRWSASV